MTLESNLADLEAEFEKIMSGEKDDMEDEVRRRQG